MRKVYKIKEWYSIQNATKRLSLTLSEEITPTELLELVLEGHLSIYWYIRHVPAVEVQFGSRKLPLTIDENNDFVDSEDPNEFVVLHDYWPSKESMHVTYLEGSHRLRLETCGALSDFLRAILTGTGGDLCSLDGFQVESMDEKIWRIMASFGDHYLSVKKENWNEKRLGKYHYDNVHNFYPSMEWPDLSELGINKNELEEFEKKLQDNSESTATTRERNTLLKLIIGMATDGYGFDLKAKRSPFAKELEGILDTLGISVSDDTIRKWLKEAGELLPPDADA